MISVAVTDYDDEGIVEECEAGWRRFCAETLVRTHYHIKHMCSRYRRHGLKRMLPKNRKQREVLRRQVAAYRWAFEGTGGLFTFSQTCADVGLCPHLMRQRLLSLCRPPQDINLLVEWVSAQREVVHGNGRVQDQADCGMGTSIVAAVRDFHSRVSEREGRRGAQTHAVCRYQDGHAHRRRPL